MLDKSTVIVFTIVYIIAFHKDYKHRVSQAKKFEKGEARPQKPTFRDLPIGRLRKNEQNIGPVAGTDDGVTRPGYLRLVNQVNRLNSSTMNLKKRILSQNKTIFHKDILLKRHKEEIERQKDKIKIYKAQLNRYKLILNENDKDLKSNISLASDEEEKKSKEMQNLGDKKSRGSSLEEILLTTPSTNLTVQNMTERNIMVQNTTIQNTTSVENTMVQNTML